MHLDFDYWAELVFGLVDAELGAGKACAVQVAHLLDRSAGTPCDDVRLLLVCFSSESPGRGS